VTTGCNTTQRSSPNVATIPPYWHSQNQQTHNQVAEMRAFHEKESEKMSEDLHVFRNREMERLEATSKELEKDRHRQHVEKTSEPSGKWTGWFKKKSKESEQDIPLVSEASKDLR